MKKSLNFMKKHPMYNAIVHAVGGIGIGILLAYPVAGAHPVRFALFFIVLSILGHLATLFL